MTNSLFEDIDRQLKKVKKANGEIIGVNVVYIFTKFPCSPQEAGGMGLLTLELLYFHFRHGICSNVI